MEFFDFKEMNLNVKKKKGLEQTPYFKKEEPKTN